MKTRLLTAAPSLCLVLLWLAWLPCAQVSRTSSRPLSSEQFTWQTSPQETCVGGGGSITTSVRVLSEGFLKLTIAPTYDELAYEIVSGRRQWLNRDPSEIQGGVNLYPLGGNSPINFFDPWGIDIVGVTFSIETALRYHVAYKTKDALSYASGADYVASLDPNYYLASIDTDKVKLNTIDPDTLKQLVDDAAWKFYQASGVAQDLSADIVMLFAGGPLTKLVTDVYVGALTDALDARLPSTETAVSAVRTAPTASPLFFGGLQG